MKNIFNFFKVKKSISIIMLLYLLFCVASSIYMFVIMEVRNGLMALLFILFIPLLILGGKLFRFELSSLFTLMIYLLASGGLSGTIYELYIIIPIFDDILHGLSGFIFASLGFTLMKHFVGEKRNSRNFVGCIFLSFCLSLAIAVIWELFEYSTTLLGLDMLEDTIITSFDSYLLAGSHSEVVSVNGIYQTIIYYGDGLSITIDGYLDIGIIDTINDMLVCLVGTIIFILAASLSYVKCPIVLELLVPKVSEKTGEDDDND